MSTRPHSTRRSKSAKARLTPTEPMKPKQDLSQSAKERAEFALLNREKNESSKKVFPRPSSGDKKERYRTIYNKDFEGSFITPLEPRPTSPTRRNNPHPSKQFMVWRVPSREIGVPFRPGSSMGGPIRDDESEFDDYEYVQDRFKVPLPEPSSMEYGAYLREMRQRQQQQLQQQQLLGSGDRVPSRLSQRGDHYGRGDPQYMMRPTVTKPAAYGEDILSRTVKDSNQDSLANWLQTATPEEKQTVVRMLKEAEEGQMKETIGHIMKPGAAKATADWLKKADDQEREVAARLFSSLGSRSGKRERSLSEPGVRPMSRRMSLPSNLPSEQRLLEPTVGGKPWPKSLWHHLPVRDPPPRVYHRGSLFGKGSGGASHYTIHPEWPDYQQSSFSSDVVH